MPDTRRAESLFYEPEERLVGMIGQGYMTSVLQGSVAKSIMVLSDKRLYQKGKFFERQSNGHFRSMSGSRVVAIQDVTGTSFAEENAVAALILGIIGVVVAILGLLPGGSSGTSTVVFMFGAVFAMMMFMQYFVRRRRLFVVEYPGGAIATDARWYNEAELSGFQKQIELSKAAARRQPH